MVFRKSEIPHSILRNVFLFFKIICNVEGFSTFVAGNFESRSPPILKLPKWRNSTIMALNVIEVLEKKKKKKTFPIISVLAPFVHLTLCGCLGGASSAF